MKKLTLTATCTLAAGISLAAPNDKPNILFIMTDQQSYKMLSCAGNEYLSTPAMDRIAAEGYRFAHAYCVNPVSLPSRFSLTTGHYGSEIGVRYNTAPVNQEALAAIGEEGLLGRTFRDAGYNTLYAGKIHLPGPSGYNSEKRMDWYGFKLITENPRMEAAQNVADFLGDYKQGDQPYFMFVSLINPHDICFMWNDAIYGEEKPQSIPQDSWECVKGLLAHRQSLSEEEYRKQVPPLAANVAPVNDPPHMDSYQQFTDKEKLDFYSWSYHRFTEIVDREIAVILEALDKSQAKENTIVVFTSDHGDQNGAHQLIMKNRFYEESTRIPFIFSGPGIRKGVVDNVTLACNGLDLYPTLCDLAGITWPAQLTGISLKPQLTGNGKPAKRDYLFIENTVGFMVMDGRYKYGLYEGIGNNELLVDIEKDPGETVNLAYDPKYKEIRDKMHELIVEWMSERGLKLDPSLTRFPKESAKRKSHKSK